MHHHSDTHTPLKNLRFFKIIGILLMLLSYMALFYNASAQDDGSDSSDLLKGKINWLSLILTLLLGVGQGVEIHDHAMGHSHHHGHGEVDEDEISISIVKSDSIPSSASFTVNKDLSESHVSIGKIALRSVIPLALGGFGCYAIWNQAQSFAQQNLAISISLFLPNLARFILLPGRHMKALVNGTEHELMHEVTIIGGEEEKKPISVCKKASLFILYSACHVADSQLLANQVKDQSIIYWLSVLGLSGSNACYHVTHSLNVKAAYQEYKKLSSGYKCVALGLSGLVGILHASQPFLGLVHLLKMGQPLVVLGAQGVATVVECSTGSIDAMQHISMWATRSSEDALDERLTYSLMR